MEEDGGLSHLRLLQLLIGASKHNIGDTEAKDLVSFLKELLCLRMSLVKILPHADELCALARENISGFTHLLLIG